MPPGQVSRGQEGTGLRFLARSLSLWRKRDNNNHVSNNSKGFGSGSKGSDNSGSGKSGSSGSASSSRSSAGGSKGASSAIAQSGTGKSSFPTGSSPPPCILACVPDNDPRVVYSTSWSLTPFGFFQTSHQTDVVGSSLSFNFNGTGITVFGSIPASNATDAPPTAAYSIDAAAPVVTAEPMAPVLVPNQPLFSVSGLSNGPHTLNVTVTAVRSVSPFAVDYFIVKPAATSLPSSSSASPSPSASVISPVKAIKDASTKSSSGVTAGILAGVLGAITFVLLCVVAFLIVILRRRRRALRSKDLQSSLFTSPESILRYSREPSSHYPVTSNPWLAKTRSVVGKSWITNLETKSISEKSTFGDVALRSYGRDHDLSTGQ